MKIKERWQRFRAGRSGAHRPEPGSNEKGMQSPTSCENLSSSSPQKPAPPRKLRQQLSGYLPRLHRPPSPTRPLSHDFSTQKLAWRFSSNTGATLGYTTGDATHSDNRRDGGKKSYRRRPSRYPGRCTPPPPTFFSTSPQPMTSTWDNHVPYQHARDAMLSESQTQTLHEALSTPPPAPQVDQPSTPRLFPQELQANPNPNPQNQNQTQKPRRPLKLHTLRRNLTRTSSPNGGGGGNSSSHSRSSKHKDSKPPKDKRKKSLRQRQKEREKQINRHIVTPEQKEHQRLLNSYSFPPRADTPANTNTPAVMTTPTKTGKLQGQGDWRKRGWARRLAGQMSSPSPSPSGSAGASASLSLTESDDADDDDAGHDGDDAGHDGDDEGGCQHDCAAGQERGSRWQRDTQTHACMNHHRHQRRRSSKVSPCSSRPRSLSWGRGRPPTGGGGNENGNGNEQNQNQNQNHNHMLDVDTTTQGIEDLHLAHAQAHAPGNGIGIGIGIGIVGMARRGGHYDHTGERLGCSEADDSRGRNRV